MRGRKEKPKDIGKLIQKDIFTTFDVSRICQANIASIKNWIMKGYLRAFRTPGGHYRVQKKELVNFLRKYHMPNPFSGEMLRLYFFAQDTAVVERLAAKLATDHEAYTFGKDADLFLAIGEELPDALIVDVDEFDAPALASFLEYIRASAKFEGIKLVALGDTGDAEAFDRVIKKGTQARKIVDAVQEIL
jgi:hypothetical protein